MKKNLAWIAGALLAAMMAIGCGGKQKSEPQSPAGQTNPSDPTMSPTQPAPGDPTQAPPPTTPEQPK